MTIEDELRYEDKSIQGQKISFSNIAKLQNVPLDPNSKKVAILYTSSEQKVTKENTSGSQPQNTGLFAKFWVEP